MQRLGGAYSGDYQSGRTTHLVCCPEHATSKKIEAASSDGKTWILVSTWLEDSDIAGQFLPEDAYTFAAAREACPSIDDDPPETEKLRCTTTSEPTPLDLEAVLRGMGSAHGNHGSLKDGSGV